MSFSVFFFFDDFDVFVSKIKLKLKKYFDLLKKIYFTPRYQIHT